MAVFTVHVPAAIGNRMTSAERAVVIPEAFSWGAFIFGPLWFLFNRAWVGLAIAVVVSGAAFAAVAALHPVRPVALGISLLVALFYGFEARQLRRFGVGLFGYRLADVVVARNARDAEHAFFVRWLADVVPSKPVRPRHDPNRNDIIGLFPEPEGAG